MQNSPESVTEILAAVASGNRNAADSLLPMVYDELHRLASVYMSRERANHTLQPTALIHEAFLRLTKPNASIDTSSGSDDAASGETASGETASGETAEVPNPSTFQDLDHFIATAAVAMRRILVNHAKSRQTQKRGGGISKLPLIDVTDAFNDSAIDLIALDEALKKLAATDETQHRLVELRFFGGMTTNQCAKLLGISERTAYYEWSHARAWLKTQIEKD